MKVLTVEIEVSDMFLQLLQDKLPTVGRRVTTAVKKIALNTAMGEASEIKVGVKAGEAEPQAPAAKAPATPSVEPTNPKARIRAIIDATRQRLEGPDYVAGKDERADKIHSVLTGEFKRIALQLGQAESKPTLLDEDKIDQFKALCDSLRVNEFGNIDIEAPF